MNYREAKMKERLTRQEAAEYLTEVLGTPVSFKTLQKYATVGGGPRYQKFGRRVVYAHDWLREWTESKMSRPVYSSSELGVA